MNAGRPVRAKSGRRRAAGAAPTVRRLIEKRTREVLRQRRAVKKKGDGDSVHDLRVATRRLQEALDFFSPYLPKRARRRLVRRARRIRRELGGVRNADVLLGLLRRVWGRHERVERPGLAALTARIEAEAATLRRSIGGRGVPGVPGIRKRTRALTKEALRPSLASILKRGRAVTARHLATLAGARPTALTGRAAALHRLRIALKHYRYALEILNEAGSRRLRPAIARSRSLQETLGSLHDLDVLIERIRATPGVPARALILRRLREERRGLAAVALRAVEGFDPEAEALALRAILRREAGA